MTLSALRMYSFKPCNKWIPCSSLNLPFLRAVIRKVPTYICLISPCTVLASTAISEFIRWWWAKEFFIWMRWTKWIWLGTAKKKPLGMEEEFSRRPEDCKLVRFDRAPEVGITPWIEPVSFLVYKETVAIREIREEKLSPPSSVKLKDCFGEESAYLRPPIGKGRVIPCALVHVIDGTIIPDDGIQFRVGSNGGPRVTAMKGDEVVANRVVRRWR